MIRNLKALGLMAVAALAMSAMLTSAAQAETGTGIFTAGKTLSNHTASTIVGHQYGTSEVNYFKADGQEVNCDEATFPVHEGDATKDGTAKVLTVTAEYKKCVAEGRPATVTMNGCDFTFTQPKKLGTGEYTSTVDLYCPEGKAIVIHVYLFGSSTNGTHFGNVCTIEVGPHVGDEETVGHAILDNTKIGGAVDDVTASVTADEVPWTKPGNQTCTEQHTEGTDGKYRSTVTVEGKNGDEVWISDEE